MGRKGPVFSEAAFSEARAMDSPVRFQSDSV